MLYHDVLQGHDVWVLVERLHERAEDSSEFVDTGSYVCAFRFDDPPGIIVGEYLRDPDQRFRRFSDPAAAAAAGFDEASRRMK